jgi:linoleoyl-CoA desaturase
LQRPKVVFGSQDHDFHVVLKDRVERYFADNGIEKSANAAMVVKTVFWATTSLALYSLAVFGGLPGLLPLVVAGAFGFSIVCFAFNVGHDAIHGSYSKRAWVNTVLGFSFDMMGANSSNWALHHNIMHHTWTNVPKVDGDIELAPAILAYPVDKPLFFNRVQHFYAWIAYAFTSLFWVFAVNVLQAAQGDPRTGDRFPLSRWFKVAIGLAFHATLFLVIPMLVTDYARWQVVLGWLTMHLVGGFTLAIVFQMAHLVEGLDFPTGVDGRIEDNWAAHQMRTTANFAVDSWLARLITGGLNQQLEHHLFPKICHIHYQKLAPIVRQTAREHGLPYHEFPTFWDAVKSHQRLLKRNGRYGAAEIESQLSAVPAE